MFINGCCSFPFFNLSISILTFIFDALSFINTKLCKYVCIYVCMYLSYLPNPSARVGYDTRSIFKRSLTGLNSEFSFS